MYGQRAFGVPPDRHYRMLHLAGEEQPPIVVLSVIVIEAEGLEAKDANGKSFVTIVVYATELSMNLDSLIFGTHFLIIANEHVDFLF